MSKGSPQTNRGMGAVAAASLLAALISTALLAAAASGATAAKSAKGAGPLMIGDILYNNDAYQTAQQQWMQKYADSIGIKIVFGNQLGQGTNAPNLMDDLLAKGVNGVIFQPADANVAVPLVQQAQGKKIPVLGWAIPFGAGVTTPYIGLAGAVNKKPTHTYFYSINGTDEELRALTDPSSPLMEDLGLTPKEVAMTLINTMVKMINGGIPAYGSYTANVPDKALTPNCAAANAFNKNEYFAKKNLPCAGK